MHRERDSENIGSPNNMKHHNAALLLAVIIPSSVAAIRVGPAAATRRAFLGGISAAALAPRTASAERPAIESEEAILQRAYKNELDFEAVIQRAKLNALITGERASCDELERIIYVDQEAVAFEKGKLEGLRVLQVNEIDDSSAADAVEAIIKRVEITKKKIEKQVVKLKQKEKSNGCRASFFERPNYDLKSTYDSKPSYDPSRPSYDSKPSYDYKKSYDPSKPSYEWEDKPSYDRKY